jgi:hypothetical protein
LTRPAFATRFAAPTLREAPSRRSPPRPSRERPPGRDDEPLFGGAPAVARVVGGFVIRVRVTAGAFARTRGGGARAGRR